MRLCNQRDSFHNNLHLKRSQRDIPPIFFTWNAGWEIRCRPAEQLCNVCCACRGALSNQWQQRPIMSSDYVSTWPLQSGQGVLKWEFWPGGEGVSCNLHSPPPKKDINYKPKLSVFIFFLVNLLAFLFIQTFSSEHTNLLAYSKCK